MDALARPSAGTQDVDSARRLTNDLNEAIQRVGDRHDLAPHWLNDNAAAYWPTGASFDDCETVYQRDTLVVRTPPADVIFVMKLYRADPQDREDMINLWPLCTFTSPEQAAEVFHASYPHAPDDEHLAAYIGAIARDID